MEKLLKQIEQTFSFTGNRKFEKATKVVLNPDTKEKKKAKKQEVIFELVRDVFMEDSRFAPYLTKTDMSKIEKLNQESDTYEMDDEFFKRVLTTYNDVAKTALDNFFVDMAVDLVKEYNKVSKVKDASEELKKIRKNTSFTDKKHLISFALFQIKEKYVEATFNAKYSGKTIPKKVQSSFNKFEKLYQKCDKTLFSTKSTGEEVLSDVTTFLEYSDYLLGKKKVTQKEQELDLKREPKSGKTDKPIEQKGKKYKVILIVAGIAVVVIVQIAGLLHFLDKDKDKEKDPLPSDTPSVTDPVGTENPSLDEMSDVERAVYVQKIASNIHDNWTQVGSDYTVSDIQELIYFLNGYESSISASIADDMIQEIINLSTIPAVNNVIVGENKEKTKSIELSDLLLKEQEGIEAIESMEDYLNETVKYDEDVKDSAKDALEDEIRVVINGETVDGLNLETASPEVKLLWSRLTIGTNAMTGLLGEDLVVTVDGKEYTQGDINNYDTFDSIAATAKQELGEQTKTLTK